MRGFRNFLLRGDVIVIAVGLIVALAFSTLISAFTTSVINPIIARAEGKGSIGLGFQLGSPGNKSTFLNIGSFISAIVYY
jgi:large conductance mechanosensitive channel